MRRTGTEESTVTEAIRAAGLGGGGSFRFVPGAVEELGMVPALGSDQEADGRSEQLTRTIYREGADKKTLRLIIPLAALREIVDPESINWANPPEVDVWAGDRMLAFPHVATTDGLVSSNDVFRGLLTEVIRKLCRNNSWPAENRIAGRSSNVWR